jgi:2-polyprenyl-6-methoxyphenol hydroxylase-like FAD-dependent oxidoreductase
MKRSIIVGTGHAGPHAAARLVRGSHGVVVVDRDDARLVEAAGVLERRLTRPPIRARQALTRQALALWRRAHPPR